MHPETFGVEQHASCLIEDLKVPRNRVGTGLDNFAVAEYAHPGVGEEGDAIKASGQQQSPVVRFRLSTQQDLKTGVKQRRMYLELCLALN